MPDQTPCFGRAGLPVLVLLLTLAGCRSTGDLHRHDLTGRTVAAVAAVPPATLQSLGDAVIVDRDRPAGTLVRVGAALAKERALRRAEARLDSALRHVDVADRLARETLLRGARHLRYRPTSALETADFVLDLHISRYGLQARSWDVAVDFILEGEIRLLETRTRRTIWHKEIHQHEPISASILGFDPVAGDVFTAAVLAGLSVEEMTRALERLTDHAAYRLAEALRHDYYDRR